MNEQIDSSVPFTESWANRLRQLLGESFAEELGVFAIPDDLLLTVVIPVYNEESTLHEIVQRVARVPIRKQIVLVDDASVDRSAEIMKEQESIYSENETSSVECVFHEKNRGKGAALRSGFAVAKGQITIVQDADLEYNPNEYPRLVWPIVCGEADVVYGSRFLGDHPHRVLYYSHYVANKLLTTLSNCTTNLNLTDMETCYKVFRTAKLQELLPHLKQDRFGFEPEITAKVARTRLRVFEVAISYHGRTYDEGKKIGFKDAINALWCIARYRIAN